VNIFTISLRPQGSVGISSQRLCSWMLSNYPIDRNAFSNLCLSNFMLCCYISCSSFAVSIDMKRPKIKEWRYEAKFAFRMSDWVLCFLCFT